MIYLLGIVKKKSGKYLLNNYKVTKQLIEFYQANEYIVKIILRLTKPRNDISHAGWVFKIEKNKYESEARTAEKLKIKIKELVKDFENSQTTT